MNLKHQRQQLFAKRAKAERRRKADDADRVSAWACEKHWGWNKDFQYAKARQSAINQDRIQEGLSLLPRRVLTKAECDAQDSYDFMVLELDVLNRVLTNFNANPYGYPLHYYREYDIEPWPEEFWDDSFLPTRNCA